MEAIKEIFDFRSPKEKLKAYTRSLNKTARFLESERAKLQREEKSIIVNMKKAAKEDQMASVRVLAKDLVSTRRYIVNFYRMKAQIVALTLRMHTISSTAQMATAMKGLTKSLAAMNKSMNMPKIERIMDEFEKQNDAMQEKSEMMEETMEEAMYENDEADTELEIKKVVDEVMLDFKQKIGVSSTTIPNTKNILDRENELESRFNQLKHTK